MTWAHKIERIEGDPLAGLPDERYETLLAFHIAASARCARQWEEKDSKHRQIALFSIQDGETRAQAFNRILDTSMHDLFFQANLMRDDMRQIENRGNEPPEMTSTAFMWDKKDLELQDAIPARVPHDSADPECVAHVMLEAYRKASGIPGNLDVKSALDLCLR